ncbi:MAG TPA: 4-alpha-glucanotransferase [Acholeplasma sp.]|nr:4-alpha-glucanotransferase [Acholeplasma sp.]
MSRTSGILLHVTSLPSNYGIGTFGKEAYRFVDFLEKTNQTYWQFLPLGPTSFGDSPYQSFSINALNPYFIDLDILVKEGLLKKKDIIDSTYSKKINYGKLYSERYQVLRKAFNNFDNKNQDYLNFINNHHDWVYDYAHFMAIKKHFDDVSLMYWPKEVRTRDDFTLHLLIEKNEEDINFQLFLQYQAYKQFYELKKYANKKGIKLIGDIPIYVSYDSSDVWTRPELFMLDHENIPTFVAGVPPDNFSKDGQLWGNPLYNWPKHQEENFKWWIKRIKRQIDLFDVIRIDHFIGFVNYYKIPATDETAANGVWEKALGRELFKQVKQELGELNIIAEDLGVITDEVRELLKDTGFPGMKLLQFAFDSREESDYIPHLYPVNAVAYTGTHDNETTKEWFSKLNENDLAYCLEYINCTNKRNQVDSLIKETLKSPAKLAIIPMQDYLGLGSEGRMNIPSTLGNNWMWRLNNDYETKDLIDKIKRFTNLYGRRRKEF